jgi:hypothetical protein
MPFDATPDANRVIVVPALLHHVDAIAATMRPMDAAECWSLGVAPLDGLRQSCAASLACWTALEAGRPIAMWGVSAAEMMGRTGCPWLLGSERLGAHRRQFLRESRARLAPMKAMFPRLENHVLADYRASVRWLAWLGFTLDDPAPMGPFGAQWRRFWMEG